MKELKRKGKLLHHLGLFATSDQQVGGRIQAPLKGIIGIVLFFVYIGVKGLRD